MGFVSAGCTAQSNAAEKSTAPSALPCEGGCDDGREETPQGPSPPPPARALPLPASPCLLRSDAACGVQLAVMTISVWRRLQEITGDLRPRASAQPERNGRLLLISHAAILGTLLH